MPLASSRTSTSKAGQARLSLPSTIDSSTKVTKSKAMKRRASLRGKRDPSPARAHEHDKENHSEQGASVSNARSRLSLGPTPYWQVAEEREGATSPRLTRSATKKPRLPPSSVASPTNRKEGRSGGIVLSFSPPNQEANRLREERELQRKELERARRIAEARKNGQLLIFSPNGTGHYAFESDENESDARVSLQLSPNSGASETDDKYRPASGTDNDQVANELKNIREAMNKLLEVKSHEQSTASAEVIQAEKLAIEAQMLRSEYLATSNAKLEKSNQQLEGDVKQLETKLATEKETYLIEKTRLEGELDASKREFSIRVQNLEENRKLLGSQVDSAQKERTTLMHRVAELENELKQAQGKISKLMSTLEALRSETQAERETLIRDSNRLSEENATLKSELTTVKKIRDQLVSKAAEYEDALDSMENQLLPESEAQLKDALDKLRLQKEAANEAEILLKESHRLIEEMKSDIKALEHDKEEERVQFQALNEESSKAFTKLKNESSSKQQIIDSLSQQLLDVEATLVKEKSNSDRSLDELSTLQRKMDERLDALNKSVNDMRGKLEVSEKQKNHLEEQLEKAMSQVALLSNAKNDALAEYTNTSASLEEVEKKLAEEHEYNKRLQNEGRERQLRIIELEKQLKITLQERDDASSRMNSFDMREDELFRKLRESDRIRRDLHNRVMQLSGNIRVYVRVRPSLPGERVPQPLSAHATSELAKKRKHEEIVEDEDPFNFPGVYDRDEASPDGQRPRSVDDLCKNIVEVVEPYKDRGGLNPRRKKWRFAFDHVFSPSQGQDDIWEATEPLVQSAIDGYNVCIFAYGQTGSGKTYTMLGEPSNEGLIARSVTKLFEAKREMEALSRGATEVILSVELLEIYNEQVRDLLAPNSSPSGREINLKLTSNEVVGNVVVTTSSKEEVIHVLNLAQKRRCVKATNSNAESSRSHMLFTIHFNVQTQDGVSRAGKMHICDLAGSERLGKSGANEVARGALLTETKHINSSLSVLSNVIERLQAGNANVPYRESKLTFLLQNSLGGNSKTLAIVCCNPLASHFHESLCSLRFAAKVNKVDLKAVANFSC